MHSTDLLTDPTILDPFGFPLVRDEDIQRYLDWCDQQDHLDRIADENNEAAEQCYAEMIAEGDYASVAAFVPF